jgi:hypothetical protein
MLWVWCASTCFPNSIFSIKNGFSPNCVWGPGSSVRFGTALSYSDGPFLVAADYYLQVRSAPPCEGYNSLAEVFRHLVRCSWEADMRHCERQEASWVPVGIKTWVLCRTSKDTLGHLPLLRGRLKWFSDRIPKCSFGRHKLRTVPQDSGLLLGQFHWTPSRLQRLLFR